MTGMMHSSAATVMLWLTKPYDRRRGVVLSSGTTVPGRYESFDMGFADPPLRLEATGVNFFIHALNARGKVLIAFLGDVLREPCVVVTERTTDRIGGHILRGEAPANEEERTRRASIMSLVRAIIAALSYGFAATYGKRFRGLAPPVTAAGQLTASSLIMLPLSLVIDQPWTLAVPPMTSMLAVLALALISTAYGYILFFRIMSRAGATNTSLVTLLVPPSAILLGFLFLGETLESTDIIGMLLIAAGLVVLDGRILRHGQR